MEDSVPFDVLDGFPDTGDLSDQTSSEAIEAAKSVRFTIAKVEPRVYDKDGTKLTAKLNVRVVIGALGVNGEGKYAGKNLFHEMITWYNADVYIKPWWKNQARFPYKSFLKALGLDPSNPPKVTDEFLTSLQGKEFMADIRKVEMESKNDDGKYVGNGDFKNELTNVKAVAE